MIDRIGVTAVRLQHTDQQTTIDLRCLGRPYRRADPASVIDNSRRIEHCCHSTRKSPKRCCVRAFPAGEGPSGCPSGASKTPV
jgi:hypothetical protein